MQDGSLDFNNPLTPANDDKLMVARLDTEGIPTAGGYYDIDELSGFISENVVIDNLTSTSPTSALSANQGKVLNELKANIIQESLVYPTLLNGTITTSVDAIRYYKDTIGEIHIKGTIQNSDGTSPCIQLVTGYRTTIATSHFTVTSNNNNTLDKAKLLANGEIYVVVPDSDTVYINLAFRAV